MNMCFSAEVSFVAAAALLITGSAMIKNFVSRNYFCVTLIPLLFGLQQFSEGVLWTHLNSGSPPNIFSYLAERAYLFFAFFIWPVWIPLSLATIEKINWRRNLLYFILACGVTLSLTNLYFAFHSAVNVNIIQHSLQYQGTLPPQTFLYPSTVVLPIFISSVRNVWIFGALISVAYALTAYLYEETFVSVWCFFAAIVSLILYKVLRDDQQVIDAEKA